LHRVLLRQAVAAVRGAHRHRVLRAALLRQAGRLPPRIPSDLPWRVFQRDDHGVRQSLGDQDRRRDARLGSRNRGPRRRCRHRDLRRQLRVVGCRADRLRPVRDRDDRGRVGGRRRAAAAPGRRSVRVVPPPCCGRSPFAVARFLGLAHRGRRFIAPDKDERHYVTVGRIVTVFLIALACAVSLWLQHSSQAFQILLQIGAGTGLIFLLRWFWWRINAWSELAGMVISFLVALYFTFVHRALGFAPLDSTTELVIGVAITTVGWLLVTFLTPPTDRATPHSFYDRIRPMGPGWRAAVQTQPGHPGESLSAAFLCWFLGVAVIYATLCGTGYLLYGKMTTAVVCLVVAGVAAWGLFRAMRRVGFA